MIRYFKIFLLSIFGFLVACGGGSSGGGGNNIIPGTYQGTGDITISGNGQSITFSGSLEFTITEDNRITFGDPGQPAIGTGSIDGNQFTVNVPASFANEPGLTCVGTLVVTGTIDGATITGSITSSGVNCNGVPITMTGTFSATLVARASATIDGTGIAGSLRSALSQTVQ